MLIGVEPRVRREFDRTGVAHLLGEENIFASSSSIGGPLREALAAANEWVTGRPKMPKMTDDFAWQRPFCPLI